MGMIRKTASLLTLGTVNWRSKQERLDRTIAERDAVQAKLERTDAQREQFAERGAKAQRRSEKAELELLSQVRKTRRRKRREGKIKKASDAAGEMKRKARRKAKRQAKRAQKVVESAAHKVTEVADI